MHEWTVRSSHSNRSTDRMAIQQREHEVRNGVAAGQSNNEIARNVGICSETVARIRLRLQLPNVYGKYPKRDSA